MFPYANQVWIPKESEIPEVPDLRAIVQEEPYPERKSWRTDGPFMVESGVRLSVAVGRSMVRLPFRLPG